MMQNKTMRGDLGTDNLFPNKKQTERRHSGSREKPVKLEKDKKSPGDPFNPNFCGFPDEDVVLMVSELIREPCVLNLGSAR